MKFVALGRTEMFYRSIERCVANGHEVVLIGTNPAAPEYTVGENDFRLLAGRLGCPFFLSRGRIDDATRVLLTRSGAGIAISMNWQTLLPPDVLRLFRHGVVNAHAGDLPRYRGNACPNWAILRGETRIVLTLHEMSEDLDAGDILLQRHMEVASDTYIGDVYAFMMHAVPEMFATLVDQAAAGHLSPRPQSRQAEDSLRCYPRRPEDGLIDWSHSAETVCRLVRASAEPFAGAFTFFEGRPVRIWRAHVGQASGPYASVPGQLLRIDRDNGTILVAAGNGEVVVESISLADGQRAAPTSILTSTRQRLEGPAGVALRAILAR